MGIYFSQKFMEQLVLVRILNEIQQTADGYYAAAGLSDDGKPYLLKVNTAGDTLWSKTYQYLGYTLTQINSFQQTIDGGYIIGTHSMNNRSAFIKN